MREGQLHSPLSRFGKVFLVAGLTVQLVTYYLAHSSMLSLISGMLGICSVVLCAERQILTFLFGFAQISTYAYICYTEHLYGLLFMNAFYFLSQIYGIYVWRRRLNQNDVAHGSILTKHVLPRQLPSKVMAGIAVTALLVSLLTGWLLGRFTDDTQPYLDAFTTIPAIAAQILLVLAYREQWFIWLFIDVLYVIMWARAGDWCLFAQHIFWCANCVYGWLNWKESREQKIVE